MVKVKYDGIYNPCEIKVLGNRFKNWYRGEVRNISEQFAAILNDVNGFTIVEMPIDKKSHKKQPVKTVEKVVSNVEIDNENDIIDLDTATKDEMLDYTARHGIEVDYWRTKDEIRKLIENYIDSQNRELKEKAKE